MFSLRLADPADLPAIVDIYNSTVASREVTADTEPVTVESRLAWFRAHQRLERPLWVAEPIARSTDTGIRATAMLPSVLGWMTLSDFYGRPAYSATAEISLYCHEAVRGRGLGSLMLSEAIKFAPQAQVQTLLGFVFGHNKASRALFAKYRFETWGHLDKVASLDGIERDLLILGRRV
ncbi:GNAT family N-acetyltransferase [soil metagenome]